MVYGFEIVGEWKAILETGCRGQRCFTIKMISLTIVGLRIDKIIEKKNLRPIFFLIQARYSTWNVILKYLMTTTK